MNRNQWDDEERVEYDAICEEALASAPSTRGRVEAYLSLIDDAVQAHRFFARHVELDMKRRGAAAQLKGWQKANAQVAVSYAGQILSKPRVIGTSRTDAEGRTFATQTLFDFMSWAEIADKITEYAAQVESYRANIALCLRLLDLRDAAPTAETPADAAKKLGTTVEAWVGQVAA